MFILLFAVDFSNAGTLDQEIQIIGPSGVDVVYDTRELGHMWKEIIFEPEEPGKYLIYVRYGGFDLPGKSLLLFVTMETMLLVLCSLSILITILR